jgi:uncharacterized membrane protein
VGGDLLDLSSLLSAGGNGNATGRRAAATAAVLGVTALDVVCAQGLSRESERGYTTDSHRTRAAQTITVNRSPDEVRRFWYESENLPSSTRQFQADVSKSGSVSFEPASGGRGTVIKLDMPSGKIRREFIENDLRRFKQIMETGEVVQSDASIHRGMHPARPSERRNNNES